METDGTQGEVTTSPRVSKLRQPQRIWQSHTHTFYMWPHVNTPDPLKIKYMWPHIKINLIIVQ